MCHKITEDYRCSHPETIWAFSKSVQERHGCLKRMRYGAERHRSRSAKPLSLRTLSIDIRFPDLGTKEKNVKRMRKSQTVPLSYNEVDESNDNFGSSQ
jgi:hypothetical protein